MKRMLILAVLLAGCERPPVPEVRDVPRVEFATGPHYFLRVITDPDTACQYLIYSDRTLTPRVATDGKTHMGCHRGSQ
jgi:hypothetical protein